uniref:Ionotropic glutamate receptor C-terminal domain-containing protein n=1 Tax=Daphnia galeata TaxID=27404 RepID=A0A8J2WL04_9CRUS|nr:unnamed protein product [Daphnia galeata]
MLLSQGGPCLSKRLQIRLVAGVWCLATFLFVQAYSSVLFTYVVAPVNRPIINSIYDVIYNNDISLFKNDTTVLLTKLTNKLDSISNSRCINISDCVYQVKPGSRNVYMEGSLYAKDQIRTDFKRTGKCNLQFAKEGFFNYYVTFALPKNSPYTQSINQGLLKLQQTGIIDYWDLWFRPMPPQCNGKPISGNKAPQKKSSLSFKNLTGAFILIGVGLSLSTLVFLCEQIVFMRERHQRRTRNKVTDADTI